MESLRFSRATFRIIERGVAALEKIGRLLERYNDHQEGEREQTTDNTES